MKLSRPMWKVNLSYRWTAKAQWSLHIHAVSPEPSLFAQTIWATRASLIQKSRGSSPTHWLRVRIWRITKVPFVVRWLRYMSKSVTGSMLYIWYASQIKRTIKAHKDLYDKNYLNGYNHVTLYVKASLGMSPKLCDSSSTIPISYVCTIKYYDCKGFHILF